MRIALPFLVACAPEGDVPVTAEDVAAEVEAQGPYAVGWTTAEVTWQPPGTDAPRTLPVEVWYPAASADGPAALYRVAGVAEVPSAHATLDPSPADDGPFPVAVYSHGSGGVGMLAYPYAERFASHGWVVIAPEHVGNTSLDLLTGPDPFQLIALHRPFDVAAALDGLEDGFGGDLPALGRTDDVYLFGHSFGAWTSLATAGARLVPGSFTSACPPEDTSGLCDQLTHPDVEAAFDGGFADARIAALGPQAPAIFRGYDEDALANLAIPTLMQTGERDVTTPHDRESVPLWQALAHPDDLWMNLRDGAHYTFISVCPDVGVDIIETFQPGARADGCGSDFTPILDALPVLASWQLAFARRHLLDDASMDLYLGGSVDLPRVPIQRR